MHFSLAAARFGLPSEIPSTNGRSFANAWSKPTETSGLLVWVCVLKSGVHATLAGVVIALFIPLRTREGSGQSPLKQIEHGLAPWVAFGVMPIFAFANAGVSLTGLQFADLFSGIPLGIAAGLFIGKQVGIMSFVFIGVKLGIARLPQGVTWMHVYGASLLAGIGFTMSLFIGTLAFSDPEHASAVRIGVLAGSLLSGILGYAVLRLSTMMHTDRMADDAAALAGAEVAR